MRRAGSTPKWQALHGFQEGHCRECGGGLTGRRTSWCSDECVETYMIRAHPASARDAVDKRDKGVCAACHLDCGSIREQILEATAEVIDLWNGDRGTRWVRWSRRSNVNKQWPQRMLAQVQAARQEILEPFGWDHLWRRSTFYDVDHRIPVFEGGESTMENLRTLCLTCHTIKTAEEATRRAGGT